MKMIEYIQLHIDYWLWIEMFVIYEIVADILEMILVKIKSKNFFIIIYHYNRMG